MSYQTSHSRPPYRSSMSLSVSTRSMSRLAASTSTSTSISTLGPGARASTSTPRLPLPQTQTQRTSRPVRGTSPPSVRSVPPPRSVLVSSNDGRVNSTYLGKRRAPSPDEKPRKVVRLDGTSGGSSTGLRYPATPHRLVQIPSTPHRHALPASITPGRASQQFQLQSTTPGRVFVTPNRSGLGVSGADDAPQPQPHPTPARELLRQRMYVDEDDEESPIDPSSPVVARPPTPPRKHDRASATATDDLPAQPQPMRRVSGGKQSTTPDVSPPVPERQRIQSLDSMDMTPPKQIATPLPMISRIPIATPSSLRPAGAGAAGISGSTTPSLLRPPTTPGLVRSPSTFGMLRPPSSPGFGSSPGRVGGISRLGMGSPARFMPSSPSIPRQAVSKAAPAPAATSSTGVLSGGMTVSTEAPAAPTVEGPAPPTITFDVPSEDVEMDDAMSSGLVDEEVKPAPSTTENSKAGSSTSTSASMPPPSRIPVIRSSKPSMQPLRPTGPKDEGEFKKPALPSTEKPEHAKATSAPSSLPERRPSSRPTMRSSQPSSASVDPGCAPAGPVANSASSSSTAAPEAGRPIRRKPSYPSSLGHGPPMRQTPRMVSVPVPSHIIDRSSTMDIDDSLDSTLGPAVRPSPRSVSDPAPRSRLSLSMSTRREGWMDTSKSLVGLSEALERLKVKKEVEPTRRPSSGSTSLSARQSLSLTTAVPLQEHRPNPNLANLTASTSTSSRLAAVHKPRQSSSITITITGATIGDESMVIDDAANDKSLAALMSSTSGGTCLKGVVAFVDVFTADGTDSSAVFVDMLRSLGARVLSRPTDSVTHIIFKSGRPSTLSWYRKQSDPPHMVGISWVTKSKEAGRRVEEDKYRVDIGEVEEVFAKRRKSMEPRALGLGTAPMGGNGRPSFLSANVLEARRKSMQHLPKISSPLKKGYGAQHEDSE